MSTLVACDVLRRMFPRECAMIHTGAWNDHDYDFREADRKWNLFLQAADAELTGEQPLPPGLPNAVVHILQPPSLLDSFEETVLQDPSGLEAAIPSVEQILLYELGLSQDRDRADDIAMYLRHLLVKYAGQGVDRRNWYTMVGQILTGEPFEKEVAQATRILEKLAVQANS